MYSQSHCVNAPTKLSIKCLLWVEPFLHYTTPPKLVGHTLVRIGNECPILHDVGVSDSTKQRSAVGDCDNRFNQIVFVNPSMLVVFVEQANFLFAFNQLKGDHLPGNQSMVLNKHHLVLVTDALCHEQLVVAPAADHCVSEATEGDIVVGSVLNLGLHRVATHFSDVSHAEGIIDLTCCGVNDKIKWGDSHKFTLNSYVECGFSIGNLSVTNVIGNQLSSLVLLNNNLPDAGAIQATVHEDFSYCLRYASGVEVFTHGVTEHRNVSLVLIGEVVIDIKPLTTTKGGFFQLSNCGINCLCQCWSD